MRLPSTVVIVMTLLAVLANPPTTSANPSGTDVDRDGIDDGLEMDLAIRFFPHVHYSQGDGCLGPLPVSFPPVRKPVLVSVSHPVTSGGQALVDTIAIFYDLLYGYDCGATQGFVGTSHAGDNESFLVFIRYDYGLRDWRFASIGTDPHRDTGECRDKVPEISTSAGPDGRGDIWVGHNKHSNYTYRDHP